MFAKVQPNTQIIGQNIIYFKQVASTNQVAHDLIRNNMASHGTVLIADYQSEGRGQYGKSWLSEPFENLMFSLILQPVTKWTADPFLINKLITLAMYQQIKSELPLQQVRIKWPNDILVDGKKICGILVENNFSGSTLNYSIAGIGLNVNQHFEHIQHINATSLAGLTGRDIDREQLLKSTLERIEDLYINQSAEDIAKAFDQALYGYMISSAFDINGDIVMAIVMGCDKDGCLILEIDGLDKHYPHGSIKQFIA